MRKIHVGMLISYDYAYAPTAIAQMYDRADRITLAVDKERRTWAGGTFEIDPGFFDRVKAMDPDGKIDILEGDFYDSGLTPMENDIRERNMLLRHMDTGEPKWYLQVDADEYFVDFGRFVDFLHATERRFKGKLLVWCEWVTLFRQDQSGFFYIDSTRKEHVPIAISSPCYTSCRLNCKSVNIYTNHLVLHQSWARSEDEVLKKLNNWSHKNDFDTAVFFNLWRGVTKDSADTLLNFHPLDGKIWERLRFIEGGVQEIIATLRGDGSQSSLHPTIGQILKAQAVRLLKKLHLK